MILRKILLCIIANFISPLYAIHFVAISLGEDCQAAYYLRKYGLRDAAYPLDWVKNRDFNGILELFQYRFKDYINPYLIVMQSGALVHSRYAIEFVHDFPTKNNPSVSLENENDGGAVSNYVHYISDVQAKYEPRIQRLLEQLSSSKKVYFFRTNITKLQAQAFVRLMQAQYPTLNFVLVAVIDGTRPNENWDLEKVYTFYAIHRIPGLNNWWDDGEWMTIFQNLGLPILTQRFPGNHYCNCGLSLDAK